MQVLALNSRVVLRSSMRMKIKRRLREAVRLIVTRGAAVEEDSRKDPKVVFRAEDVGADKWIVPGVFLLLFFLSRPRRFVVVSSVFITHDWLSHRLDVCCFTHIRNIPHVVCGID